MTPQPQPGKPVGDSTAGQTAPSEPTQPDPVLPAPAWPAEPLCSRSNRRVPPRLIAAGLLSLLAVRLGMHMVASNGDAPQHSVAFSLAAALGLLTLGGCLWWVAKRQIGLPGAIIALALFVTAPVTHVGAFTAMASLGVFGITYTGVGVAHALQGPRRKWPPRIAMMSALATFTGACDLHAACAALALSLLAMLYLAERRRILLPPLLLLWAACAAVGWEVAHLVPWQHATVIPAATLVPRVARPASALLGTAIVVACVGWAASRRSRYFGNSAPMLAALVLLCLYPLVGTHALAWGLSFALLFIAGVTADWLPPGP